MGFGGCREAGLKDKEETPHESKGSACRTLGHFQVGSYRFGEPFRRSVYIIEAL